MRAGNQPAHRYGPKRDRRFSLDGSTLSTRSHSTIAPSRVNGRRARGGGGLRCKLHAVADTKMTKTVGEHRVCLDLPAGEGRRRKQVTLPLLLLQELLSLQLGLDVS
jgi:hypothetical protein